MIEDYDNIPQKMNKYESSDRLNSLTKQKNKKSVYKSIQQLLGSQMFENEHIKTYQQRIQEVGSPSKPIWNDSENVDKRH